MSEFIKCNICGDLTSFEETTFINNNPICPTCQDHAEYTLTSLNREKDWIKNASDYFGSIFLFEYHIFWVFRANLKDQSSSYI